jgi:uncharacterized delta-60 repeat protein
LLAVAGLGTGVAFAATAGDQDPDFNGGAPTLIDFPGSPPSSVRHLVLAPDGSIFTAAGAYGGDGVLLLSHLDASGAPIAAFGGDGLVADDTISGLESPPEALAFASNGDLLLGVQTSAPVLTRPRAAGKVAPGDWGTGDATAVGDFTVERYDASGARVGESRVDVDPGDDAGSGDANIVAILPQADGTTLLLGSVDSGESERFVRVLLDADGKPAAGFGDDGVAVDPDPGAYAALGGHQAGGSVVIAGEVSGHLVLRRYLADGGVDASYGGTFPHGEIAGTSTTTGAFAPDGSLYMFITFGSQLYHFTAAGQPDASYGTSGIDALSALDFAPERLAVQPDGKLLLAGMAFDTHEAAVARLNADGTLDTSYGDGGIHALPLSDGFTTMRGRALALQGDDKVVVGGDGFAVALERAAVEPGESAGFVTRLGGDPKSVTTTTGTTAPATTTEATPIDTTTTTQTTATTTTTTVAPAAAPVTAASANPLPAARSCVSRRSFKIRLRIPRGAVATSATVKVDGKQVKVVKGSRLRAAIDLRGLPKTKATVSIVVKLAHGKKPLTGTRVYRTCVPRRGDSVPAL